MDEICSKIFELLSSVDEDSAISITLTVLATLIEGSSDTKEIAIAKTNVICKAMVEAIEVNYDESFDIFKQY